MVFALAAGFESIPESVIPSQSWVCWLKLFLREERLASSQFTKKPIILGLYCWLELVGVELGSSTFCALALLTTKGFTFNWVFGTLGAPLKGGLGLASFKIGIPGKFMILKTVK